MKKLLAIIFIVMYLTNVFILTGVQLSVFTDFFTLSFILLIPGSLLLILLNITNNSFWERISYILGLSVTFSMFFGVIINLVLPKVGIAHPLSQIPLLISFDIALLGMFAFVLGKQKDMRILLPRLLRRKTYTMIQKVNPANVKNFLSNKSYNLNKRKVIHSVKSSARGIIKVYKKIRQKKYNYLFCISSIVFPILATLGAVSINNNGGNFFTMVMLGGVVLYVILLLLLRNKVATFAFPTALYFIGLALLFMTSLRGWYTTGHDVQIEYYVFQLAKVHQIWDVSLYKDAYNACLSITILPTILTHFFSGSDVYVYKFIFQILFALCPVVMYLFIKKYTTRVIAFLTAFYFLSFPTFLVDMPMLNRQEIGFLFLALMIYLIFKRDKQRGETILMYAFGLSMVVSHYSTTYVTDGLLILVYVVNLIFRNNLYKKLFKKYISRRSLWKKANRFSRNSYLSLPLIIILVGSTFFWNSLITKTSNGLLQTLTQTVTGINTIFKQDNKSADTTYSLFSHHELNNEQFINNYITNAVNKLTTNGETDFYSSALYSKYKPEIIKPELVPLTPLGEKLKAINLFAVNFAIRQFCAKIIQVLILVGLVGLFFYKKSKDTLYDPEYIIACFVSMFLIGLMTVLPSLSLNYGLLRLFQQLLLFLGLPVIIGNLALLNFLGKGKAMVLTVALLMVFFLSISGFISESTGGYYPQLDLDNAGLYYDAYYVHRSELYSIDWLGRSTYPKATIQADGNAYNKLLAFADRYSYNDAVPQVLQRSSYVYVDVTNEVGKTILSIDRMLMIKFPLPFLDDNKDLIYDNGTSRVYR